MLKKSLGKERLEKQRREIKFKDPIIFEKSVYALNLLSQMVRYYPNLIFKGGTAILLYIFPPIRFSIDIDILLEEKEKEDLEQNLQRLVEDSELFNSVEEDTRESGIPKAHYKFYYNSEFSRMAEYVLLDIVFCNNPYYKLTEQNLNQHSLLYIDKAIKVKVPTPDGLFGDKMTAIAPNTIGIPLNESREMEFVKQVIDMGVLFNLLGDTEDVIKTFLKTVRIENQFRNASYSPNEILDSILDVAFKYSQSLLKRSNDNYPEIDYLNSGLKRVSNHLIGRYTQSDLKLSFAKIAYTCHVIRDKKRTEIIKTVDYQTIKDKRLKGKYQILESLKKTNPQAYFYWVLGFGQNV